MLASRIRPLDLWPQNLSARRARNMPANCTHFCRSIYLASIPLPPLQPQRVASSKWQVAMAMGLAMGTAMAMAMAMAPALVFLCPVSGSALLCLPRLSRNVARVFVAASFAIIWSICCLALSLLNLAFACYTSRACGDSQPAGYRISREYSAPPPELFFHWLVFLFLLSFFFVYVAAGSYSIIW